MIRYQVLSLLIKDKNKKRLPSSSGLCRDELVKAMEMAPGAGKLEAAQIVAAECVVEAETKDYLNWELIGQVVEKSKSEERKALKDAPEQVEKEEDEHLHTTGWARELWIESLGPPAVIPPRREKGRQDCNWCSSRQAVP
jgi:hypothetical protein